jgi:hypothetical protein
MIWPRGARARLTHNGHRASIDRSPGHSEEGGLSRRPFEFDAHVAMSSANTEAFDQALSSRLTPAAITRTGRCFRHDDSNALNEMTPFVITGDCLRADTLRFLAQIAFA